MANEEIMVVEENKLGSGEIMVANTIEGDAAGRKMAVNAVNNAQSLASFEGVSLKVANIMTKPGVRASYDNAPEQPCQNTYLITTDGEAYFSQSNGVARSINNILAVYPDFPRDTENGEYCEMVLKSQQLPNGRTIKMIEIV